MSTLCVGFATHNRILQAGMKSVKTQLLVRSTIKKGKISFNHRRSWFIGNIVYLLYKYKGLLTHWPVKPGDQKKNCIVTKDKPYLVLQNNGQLSFFKTFHTASDILTALQNTLATSRNITMVSIALGIILM